MTALVGILNKKAAVIAADSAMTVTNGERMKIYNNATKIFNLTQHGSIGVMLFNSVDFMYTPWEVIINLYRDKRGDKVFDSVKEYTEDVFEFLRSSDFFISEEEQMDSFIREFSLYYSMVKDDAKEDIDHEKERMAAQNKPFNESVVRSFIEDSRKSVGTLAKGTGMTSNFKDYTEKEFNAYLKRVFDYIKNSSTEVDWPDSFKDEWQKKKWQHSFYSYVRSRLYFNGTGLVFVGYGEKDIFPTLIPVYVSFGFDHRLRGYIDEENETVVHGYNSSYVCPFGQTDVMTTLLRGIAPSIYDKIEDVHQKEMNNAKEKIAKLLEHENVLDKIVDKVRKLSFDDFDKRSNEAIRNYMGTEYGDKIIDAIDSFSVNDMATMAENLVSITGLQRHFSSSDETVGGPIDVAVITKSDGFRWIKNKNIIN